MIRRKERYTVAFDLVALDAMATVTASTNYREVPDFIRAAVSVMIDLLDATGRKLSIVLRDGATGREWEYSPHEPGRATPITQAGTKPQLDDVFRSKLGRSPEGTLLFHPSAASAQSDETADRRNNKQRRAAGKG